MNKITVRNGFVLGLLSFITFALNSDYVYSTFIENISAFSFFISPFVIIVGVFQKGKSRDSTLPYGVMSADPTDILSKYAAAKTLPTDEIIDLPVRCANCGHMSHLPVCSRCSVIVYNPKAKTRRSGDVWEAPGNVMCTNCGFMNIVAEQYGGPVLRTSCERCGSKLNSEWVLNTIRKPTNQEIEESENIQDQVADMLWNMQSETIKELYDFDKEKFKRETQNSSSD